ncbi:MAG: YaiO family outer membrane beta-barrel protein [Candidatus Omnitrophota bacterium]
MPKIFRVNSKKFILVLLLAAFPLYAHAREEAGTDQLIRRMTPPRAVVEDLVEAKDQWYVDCFFEPSEVLQGNRTGNWDELTTSIAYIHQNIRPYLSVSQLERFDNKDYTANIGSYLSFKDSYAHLEGGFGWDIDYIYKFISIAEYGHKLYENLHWQMGYTYRAYGTDDTHLVYPMLIYYFGDSYMSAQYGVSFMEGHDTANMGSVRGDFAITNFLRWSCGLAVGERLYDINGFDAHAERGFILFTGITWNLYKDINIKAGYSHGEEAPKFIKRGYYLSASVKM